MTDFTDNLRWLFDHVPGPDGKRITTERLVAMVNDLEPDVRMSVSYANQLRRGAKDNPSASVVDAISRAFGMPIAYFYSDGVRAAIQVGVTKLHKEVRGVRVDEITRRLERLTDEQLAQVLAVVIELSSEGDPASAGID